MKLFKANIHVDLVLLCPDDYSPNNDDVREAYRKEIATNGIIIHPDEIVVSTITCQADIPSKMGLTVPWNTHVEHDDENRTIQEILDESLLEQGYETHGPQEGVG